MQEIEKRQEGPHYNFLVKNVIWLTLGRVLSTIIALFALPIITIYLSPESFGIIALFTVEASFLAGFYGLGLHSFAARIIYKYERKDKQKCRQYLGVILFYLVISSLIGLFITLPLVKILKRLILKDVLFPHPFLVYVPVIYAFFMSINGFFSEGLLSLQQNKKLFICNITEILLLVPAEIIGLVWLGFTWVEVVILLLIVKVVITFFSFWLMRKNLSFSYKRLKIIKYALRYSIPMVPLKFSSWIQQHIDKIFLGRMHSMNYVGVYAVGIRVSYAFSFFSRPIATAVKPEISKRLDSKSSNIQHDITDFFNLFFQFSVFLILAISIFSREIITLLTDVKYSNAFKVIPFIILGYMFSELTGIFQLKFIYKNKTIFFPLVTFLGAFLNASLNYYLIPRFYILGAAAATVLSQLLILFICYYISQRLHYSNYNMMKNFTLLSLCAVLILLTQNMFSSSIVAIFIKFTILTFSGALLYGYALHTNVKFRGLRDTLIKTMKEKYLSLWRKRYKDNKTY